MYSSITVSDFRTRYPEIRRRLARGETLELTYRSKPVAIIIPWRKRPNWTKQ